jgi:hypothetical protein
MDPSKIEKPPWKNPRRKFLSTNKRVMKISPLSAVEKLLL